MGLTDTDLPKSERACTLRSPLPLVPPSLLCGEELICIENQFSVWTNQIKGITLIQNQNYFEKCAIKDILNSNVYFLTTQLLESLPYEQPEKDWFWEHPRHPRRKSLPVLPRPLSNQLCNCIADYMTHTATKNR